MPDEFNPFDLITYAKWTVIGYGFSYLLMAFGLSMLGTRLRLRCTWTAWIPILNLFLMCRMARVSLMLILPALIPGLNLLVFAYLGYAMARRLESSSLLGIAFGIPIFGALVPVTLALRKRTVEEESVSGASPSQSPVVVAMVQAGAAATVLVLTGIVFLTASRLTKSVAPDAQTTIAKMPKRLASTLTEFPVDTEIGHPAKPTGVFTESLHLPVEGAAKTDGMITAEQLPPWVSPASVQAMAQSATVAVYRTEGADSHVNVVTLAMRDEEDRELLPPNQEQLAAFSPEAKVTGLELKTPENVTYRGYRVTAPEAVFYALRRGDTNTAVLISARDIASMVVAERLAATIGNGQGLLEFEEYRSSFSQMPPAPPRGTMMSTKAFTQEDFNWFIAYLEAGVASGEVDREVLSLLPVLRSIAPQSGSVGTYSVENSNGIFVTGIVSYASGSSAWTALTAIRGLQSLIPPGLPVSVRSIKVAGANGIAVDLNDDGRYFGAILLRQGSSLAAFAGMMTTQDLTPWAEGYVASQ